MRPFEGDCEQIRAARVDGESDSYRLLFDASPVPMWVIDATTLHFLAVNDAALSEYKFWRQEFLSMTIEAIVPPEETPRFIQYFQGGLTQRTGWSGGVWPHRTKTGKALLAALQTVDSDVDVDYLRDEIPKAIDQLIEGVDQVARIVRAMKEFSHPGPRDKILVDIGRAIESTILVSRNEWKYVADVTTDFDADLPPVPCLPGEFNQVILNLILNSAHAIADKVNGSGQKGAIRIGTRRRGKCAEIRVGDTGGGIPEAIQSKVFDPFFTSKEVGKGTGQGLAIAHSVIVQKHHGAIWFESETGAGTTFVIQLPLDMGTNETNTLRG